MRSNEMNWVMLITVLVVGVVLSEAQAYQESEENRPAQTQQSDSSDPWKSSSIDSTFAFSNGTSICLKGFMETQLGKQVIGGFSVRDCDTGEKLGECGGLEGCHFWFSNDTLWVDHLQVLAMGENLELVDFPWKVSTFYLEAEGIGHTERLNENLRYDEKTIESILEEYEKTVWLTQDVDNEYVGFQLMPLANKLMIAAISGSRECEMKFKEFRTRVKPDGAYASAYLIMESILEYAKSN